MKNLLLSATALVALSAPVMAGNGAPITKSNVTSVEPSWTGFYLGSNVGYGRSTNSDVLRYIGYNPGLTPQGGFIGLQAGYNWQVSPLFVVGLEGDVQLANVSAAVDALYYGYANRTEASMNSFGSLRARVGFVHGPALFYATAGYALANLHKETTDSYEGTTYLSDRSTSGFTVGGGLEYKLTSNWSAKAEYQYMGFGKKDFCEVGRPQYCWNSRTSPLAQDAFHTVRVGLNYYFN